jgi:exopolyphosphatase/guanosine-5'-triphosphate,3'-diphosphate pyrophosphatase
VHGLPVDHGLLFDLGGGSLEVSRFRDRKLIATWTLPLGALRLSDRFLRGTGQPSPRDVRRTRDFVVKTLRKAGIPRLARDEQLIGTGGTVRNLAKMEARLRRDPLPHVHGSVLGLDQVRALVRRTTSLGQSARGGIPGLNKDRADSIVGGFIAVQTAMEFVGARQLQVSGQGLREGIALATLGKGPPPAHEVRRASIEALARRFTTCNREVARRRARIAARLLEILDPKPDLELRETLQHVCLVLDIGRAVDYFDRFRNCAMILAAADLQGFTPRGAALAFAVLMQADNEANRLKTLRPALRDKDGALVARAAILLRIADEIERRSLPGQPLAIRFRLSDSALVLNAEALAGWQTGSLGERFRRAFRRELRLVAR